MNKEYGPTAFPLGEWANENGRRGMSLRAYIATEAMAAMMANPEDGVCTSEKHMEDVAKRGVMAADALLAALDAK